MADRMPSTEQFLHTTVAFGILRRLDRRVRDEISLEFFRRAVEEQLSGEDIPPITQKVVEILYERAVDAKVDIAWIPVLAQIKRSKQWKAHRKSFRETDAAAETLRKCAKTIDKRFSSAELISMIAEVSERLDRLIDTLDEAEWWNKRMERLASRSNRNEARRFLQTRIARKLKQHCPGLTTDQKVAVIKAVLEAVQIRDQEESTEAILKTLQRYSK